MLKDLKKIEERLIKKDEEMAETLKKLKFKFDKSEMRYDALNKNIL